MEPQNAGAEKGVTPGEWLSQVRAQQGLTPQQAAERLNLDVWVVEALEANRFAVLGPPVYARGHLRKYAALLGVSADEVLSRYEALSDTPTVQDPIPATVAAPIRGVREGGKGRRIVAGLIILAVLVAIAAALFKFNKRSTWVADDERSGIAPTTSIAAGSSSELPKSAPSQEVQVNPAEVAGVPPAATPNAARTEQPKLEESEQRSATANDQSSVTLHLDFSDTSWTEIYDASGKRLMFDNGIAGRGRTVTGEAPLRVTVGLASAVKIEVNGKSAVIPRRSGRESARFTVAADGSLSEG